MIEFRKWPKTLRYENETYIITEKIDGTNACIVIDEDDNIGAQSRKRLITPENDNYGFATWVQENKEILLQLGPGHHFGEWWGKGIQRGYNMDKKIFSLFNVIRWGEHDALFGLDELRTVPVLCHEECHNITVSLLLAKENLKEGSQASKGYNRPEGLIIYGTQTKSMLKYILDK